MKKGKVYTFNWEFEDSGEAQVFKEFQNVITVKNRDRNVITKTPEQILVQFMRTYLIRNKLNFTMVTEKQLLSHYEKSENKVMSRHRLKYYRDSGFLIDAQNRPLWYANGRSIIYNLEACMDKLKNRP